MGLHSNAARFGDTPEQQAAASVHPQVHLMLAIGFAGAGGFAGPSAKTTLSWVSHPLRPGETAIVSGGALSNASNVTLTTASGKQRNLKAFAVRFVRLVCVLNVALLIC